MEWRKLNDDRRQHGRGRRAAMEGYFASRYSTSSVPWPDLMIKSIPI